MKKKTFEMIPKYSAVGIVDGCRGSSLSNDPFSLTNKQIQIQRSASALKIQTLRKHYESILTMSPARSLNLQPGQLVPEIPAELP